MTETLHPEETITSIVFVRHGDTEQTEQGKLYNDPSALLTQRGRKQADAVAVWLPREVPDLLLSSTAARVVATAEVVSKTLSLPIQLVHGLNEQNVGEWEGRSYLEIKKANPEQYSDWCQDPLRNRAPAGESMLDVYERVERDIERLIDEHKGKKIVLVSHAGVIRSAIVAALGMPLDNLWRVSVPTGSISRIDYSSNFATLQFMSMRFD